MIEIRSPYDLIMEHDANSLAKAQFANELLDEALFIGKKLTGTDFNNARLIHAWFDKADVSRCDFSFANLKYARFIGSCVKDAVFTGADLSGCNFHGCVLADADLADIKSEFMCQLSKVPESAEVLLTAVNDGLIGFTGDSVMEPDPIGLVGFMADVRGDYIVNMEHKFGMSASSKAIINGWFMGIKYGDTPQNNQVAEITANWISDFINNRDSGSLVVGRLNDLPDDWVDVVGRCAVCDIQLTCYDKLFIDKDQLVCDGCNKETSVAVSLDELPL